MIQLGYCIPIPEHNASSDTTNVNEDRDQNDTTIPEEDRSSLLGQVPLHIGHCSIDWTIWDGGQIGGRPSWLNPEHLPTGPLTCHCTNTKCLCYMSQQQQQQTTSNDSDGVYRYQDDTPITSKQQEGVYSTTSQILTRKTRYSVKHPTILNFIGQFYAPPPPPLSSSSDKIENNGNVFHRSIYIFGCTKCHLSQCYHRIRVIRTQLGKNNRYWPSTISPLTSQNHRTNIVDDTIESTLAAHLPITYYKNNVCVICSFPARGKCPISQQFFCGNHHQRLYHQSTTRTGSLKNTPQRNSNIGLDQPEPSTDSGHDTTNDPADAQQDHTPVEPKSFMNGIYTMMELVVEEEPPPPSIVEIQDDNQAKLQSTLFPNTKGNERDGCDNDDDDDDDEDMEQNDLNDAIGKKNHPTDAKRRQQNEENQNVFNQFTSRITERPNCRDQVLRYNCSWPQPHDSINDVNSTTADFDDEENETSSSEPLWIRADHKPPSNIPKCPYCNSERQFEFQLMPQLLHYLNVNAVNTDKTSVATTTTATTNNTNVVLDALRQTETILEQFHPTNIPPALLEHQQSIIEQRRQQLLLRDDENDDDLKEALSSSANHKKDNVVKDLLRPPHDWGIVAVYTCPNSCSSITASSEPTVELNNSTMGNLGAYREEYVWVQPPIDVIT